MKRNILVFGLISGTIVSAFMATSMAVMGCSGADESSMTMGMIIGFGSMIAAFSFIFVGVKNYRDKHNGGVLTFGRAFLIGLLISLIASTMYVVTWGIEYHFFLPDFMDKYSAMQIKAIMESGRSAAEQKAAIDDVNTMRYNYDHNVFLFAMYTYMEILPVGVLVSLVSALILKRRTAKG